MQAFKRRAAIVGYVLAIAWIVAAFVLTGRTALEAQAPGPSAPWYNNCAAVTTSDTVDLPLFANNRMLTQVLYVGGAGNVTAVFQDGTAILFTAPPVGALLPIGIRRVNATNTTATVLVACYRF